MTMIFSHSVYPEFYELHPLNTNKQRECAVITLVSLFIKFIITKLPLKDYAFLCFGNMIRLES